MPGPGRVAATGGEGLLRPALELAFDVAKVGARSSPVIDAPRAVRPFLQFGRLPDAALVAMRRAIDEDESFRARVAGLADVAELGRAGLLYVQRPEGWVEELAALTGAADAKAVAEREESEERSARRRLSHAEQATQRAEAAAAKALVELAAATAELATERKVRRTAQEEVAQLGRRATSLEGERDSARRKAAEAVAEAAGAQAGMEKARAELAQARAALGALDAEAEAAALRAEAARLRAEAAGVARVVAPGPGRPPVSSPPADGAGLDVAAVARAVSAAAAAASALGQALDDASAALASPAASGGASGGADVGGVAGAGGGRALSTGPAPPRRRPSGLPPAVLDDTTEAAAHLVRVPDALVLVDGYNAAKALWPDVAPLELRERLVDALSELVARTGVGVHVVYDGADVGFPLSRPAGRRGVKVSFSPPEVEADDVILDLIGAIPLDRPVVVASSDRRVQEGARQRGANVISSAQLAAVLGRA